ncbi:hypothetical protein AJ80_02002 [Polytolypa hystricis UAMH7299]|uniref:Arrestin-like N-terminal domain-containing protein n=1 Tax=Polytolypa hystricis (strain UAMH7299) TaxID=1447883 RepID=A0A2B7YRX8_POLH7|nr:hypothetical protein AJ80_02002 [Polytolypa hystricis UAMH7299]
MDIQIILDHVNSVYTDKDTVSGKVLLETATPIDISTIAVRLSGIAISRLNGKRSSEVHKILRRTQVVFPPKQQLDSALGQKFTLRSGTHEFPFSITFPHFAECFKLDPHEDDLAASCARVRLSKRLPSVHLLRRLPPSTGTSNDIAEVKYSVNVVIKKPGLFKGTMKMSRDIFLNPLSEPTSQQEPVFQQQQQQPITIDPEISNFSSAPSFLLSVQLLNGSSLLQTLPLPLRITLTKQTTFTCPAILKNFQTMVVEHTHTDVNNSPSYHRQCWIVQTMSNMHEVVGDPDAPAGAELNLSNALWSSRPLPPKLVSSFETCKIKRSYELRLKVRFQFGELPKVRF